MTMLIKIGNSQGVRIPKAIIKQAHLENANLEFEVVSDGLLIKTVKDISRESWKSNIENTIKKNKSKKDEAFIEDLLNDSDLEDFEW
jgi:antitoxin MazE